MSFHLVAESDTAIKQVALYYRWQGVNLTSRAIPQFTPGSHVEASFERTLERGEIPPGTHMEYYWRLELADGTQQDTELQSFVCEDDRFPWQTLDAGQISLRYYGTEADAALAQTLLREGQAALDRLQNEIGVRPQKPVHIYVYHNPQDMAAALAPNSPGYDEQIQTLGVAVADDTLLLLGNHPEIHQTIAHELTHIVVGLATENPYAGIPHWLDEGLAMYAEGPLESGNAAALQEAIRQDALISVRSLSGYTGDPNQVDLYYGEAYSVVDFLLRTYGRDKMTQLLAVFKQGTLQDDALQQVYGFGLDELDVRWRASLGLQPRATLAPTTTATDQPPTRRSRGIGLPCAASGLVGSLGVALALGYRRPGAH